MLNFIFRKYLIVNQRRFNQIENFNDGSIKFSHNGLNYLFISNNPDDPLHFSIVLPDIDSNHSVELEYINKINSKMKLAKVVKLASGQVWIITDFFAYNYTDHKQLFAVFDRIISILEYTIQLYNNQNEFNY